MANRYFPESDFLDVEVFEGVATVSVTRIPYDSRGHWEMSEIFSRIDADPDVRVTLLTSPAEPTSKAKGQVFPHVPPEGAMSSADRFEMIGQRMREARNMVHQIINAEKPVVSAILGPCGGGVGAVQILSDISIAAEDVKIFEAHIEAGLAAGDHAVLWALLCGITRAKFHMLTCEPLTGAEAASIGLISRAVPREQVLNVARGYAVQLANGPQHAIRFTRRAMNQWLRQGTITAFELSAAFEQLTLLAPDWEHTSRLASQTDYPISQRPPASGPFPSVATKVGPPQPNK